MAPLEPFSAPSAWREIADRVYVAVAEPQTVNLGLVVGDEACLLVDTGSSPGQGRRIAESIGALTHRRLAVVVLTHWHYDHAFGLAGFPGVQAVAQESVQERLTSSEATDVARRLGLDPAELALPTRHLAVAAAIDLGGRRVEVAHLGRGHTEGDLLAVVSDSAVVFGGDLVESAGAPQFGADSFPHEWPGTLDGVIGLMTEDTQVVPGHGDVVDREFVFEARGRIAAVSGEIRRLWQAGVPMEDALAAGHWPYPSDNVAGGIAAGYAQLGDSRRRLPLL